MKTILGGDTYGDQQSPTDRQIANSKILVRYVTPFAIGWLIIATYLGAPRLAVAAAIATIGFLGGILLHGVNCHMTARLTWLLSANIAIFLGSLVVPPSGNMAYILLAAAGMPFLIFSIKRNLSAVIGLVGLPVFLWVFSWWMRDGLLAPFDISNEMAISVVAPGSAVTVFGVVLFEIAYFVTVSIRYADSVRQARQQAEVADMAKSALLKSMSHEMRTPLNAITGFADLVREEAGGGASLDRTKVVRQMNIILGASKDLLAMVENVLAFAATAGTEIEAKLQAMDLNEAFENVLKRQCSLIRENDQKLDTNIPAGTLVSADPVLLSSVIEQILDNAIKYTPAGGRITVTAQWLPDDRVKMIFHDTGPGFPHGASERAFEPFERLDFANSAQSGVGIGLSLVRTYLRAMGGEVGIDAGQLPGGVVWIVLDAA